jgi:bis(5'-nucleosyl)-tetraphosphatase (symmetrical)
MSDYAIGDIQGCFEPLIRLLKQIQFNPDRDRLWLTGDLVNRGPDSLAVLRFIKSLPNVVTVLGNHDLYLLSCACRVASANDDLKKILNAPDGEMLIDWLRNRPLLYTEDHWVLVHAGLPPQWNLRQALEHARTVEKILRSDQCREFFSHQDLPTRWHESLTGWPRLHLITYYLTQLRLCTNDGTIEPNYKGDLNNMPAHYLPWFAIPERCTQDTQILFGHWAALNGNTGTKNVYALDTGCVWGNCLTALRLSDKKRFVVTC